MHLVLGCDPVGDCPLWIEDGAMRNVIPVALSPGLKADLLCWNERMSAIVAGPDRYSTEDMETERAKLNNQGQRLARRIEEEKDGRVRVRYLAE